MCEYSNMERCASVRAPAAMLAMAARTNYAILAKGVCACVSVVYERVCCNYPVFIVCVRCVCSAAIMTSSKIEGKVCKSNREAAQHARRWCLEKCLYIYASSLGRRDSRIVVVSSRCAVVLAAHIIESCLARISYSAAHTRGFR